MDIKNSAITAKMVIHSLLALLENENVDISSVRFKVGSDGNGYESPKFELEKLVSLAIDGLVEIEEGNAVPEGFILVPKTEAQYFSHDFNGDGFKYHDTLDEAKKEAEASLDWYRDQVANGRHVNDMGEFNELSYGLVIGSAEYSIDHVVTQDDIDKGEYSYEVGTEILYLYLSEAQGQSHD
ncbi:hypothetical protein [Acinetobacter sp. SWAC57]|uniref:hypothetical protein n=1 Tax=Acinetobacter sp. SWAC57 TaxID=2293834 RepID=UPI001BC88690|nr:hypothetical protein [Acinetobacter sp. SWAC57]